MKEPKPVSVIPAPAGLASLGVFFIWGLRLLFFDVVYVLTRKKPKHEPEC